MTRNAANSAALLENDPTRQQEKTSECQTKNANMSMERIVCQKRMVALSDSAHKNILWIMWLVPEEQTKTLVRFSIYIKILQKVPNDFGT